MNGLVQDFLVVSIVGIHDFIPSKIDGLRQYLGGSLKTHGPNLSFFFGNFGVF